LASTQRSPAIAATTRLPRDFHKLQIHLLDSLDLMMMMMREWEMVQFFTLW